MRSLVFFVAFGLLLLAACSRAPVELAAKSDALNEKNASGSNSPPFATKEPEKYTAQIVFAFRFDETSEFIEQTTVVARDGVNRRLDFENGNGKYYSRLEIADGKRFILLPARKVYAELDAAASENINVQMPDEISLAHLLHIKPADARFERVGEEDVLNRRTTKYRIDYGVVNGDENLRTETFVWADEALGMPVRTEISALENGKPSGARSVMELRAINLEVDESVFTVPKNFRKIPASEIKANLR